ncbi:hypothetical protein RCH06_001832 [Polaromonas sp. CG_9.5]|uniref:hypothetical protein n=1 Tax=Polaromonas sp. CG_9.5 TaxID=3071705 RepID=UPI002E093124|nr:hypothetical protein [Polaromonas sp. CG_9.5]
MIKERILRWARARKPDFVIGGHADPYLLRWWLIPRNPVFNIYVHQFLRSDDDRALHDHPWLFNMSYLLDGRYLEWLFFKRPDDGSVVSWGRCAVRQAGDIKLRFGSAPHRIELTNGPCWTLFITGPRYRAWGFHCPKGWVHWQKFTARGDKGAIGRGCDQ